MSLFVIVLSLLALGFFIVGLANGGAATVRFDLFSLHRPVDIPLGLIPVVAVAIAAPMFLIFAKDYAIKPVHPVLGYASLLLGVGALAGQISFASAAAVLALGAGTFASAWCFALMLLRGESIELESRSGGIGGSLGGWRLSRAAGFGLVTFVLAVSTAASVRPLERPAPKQAKAEEAPKQQAPAPAPAGASAKAAPLPAPEKTP